jgi:thiol-disulfide isomerase/thioredoxin
MDYVKNLFSGDNKYKTVGLLIVFLCLIVASLYVYKKSISSKIKDTYAPNQEFVSNDADKSAVLYYFYTTWCPHCKKTMPIWDELVSELKNKELNGVTLTLIKVDCDKEQSLAESFNVQGYPTIKLVYGGKNIEYDAKLDKSTMMEFLNSTL